MYGQFSIYEKYKFGYNFKAEPYTEKEIICSQKVIDCAHEHHLFISTKTLRGFIKGVSGGSFVLINK